MDEPRTQLAALIHGLDIAYDFGEGHPLLGRRMPDLDLDTADGPTRVYTLLHDAKPLLLDFGEPARIDIAPWADRVRLVEARFAGAWELPVLGEVTPPSAVLIRPDGHVAWVGAGNRRGADGRTRPLVRSLGSATAPPLEEMWPITRPRTAISMRDLAAMRGSCRTSCSWCSCSRSTS